MPAKSKSKKAAPKKAAPKKAAAKKPSTKKAAAKKTGPSVHVLAVHLLANEGHKAPKKNDFAKKPIGMPDVPDVEAPNEKPKKPRRVHAYSLFSSDRDVIDAANLQRGDRALFSVIGELWKKVQSSDSELAKWQKKATAEAKKHPALVKEWEKSVQKWEKSVQKLADARDALREEFLDGDEIKLWINSPKHQKTKDSRTENARIYVEEMKDYPDKMKKAKTAWNRKVRAKKAEIRTDDTLRADALASWSSK